MMAHNCVCQVKVKAALRGGPAGDLYIVIRVKSHDFFEREGDDIYCEVPLTFAQAALGDEIEIPTLTEKVKLKIPAGTQTGTYFRLKGKGVPRLRGIGQGDQHVKVVVVTPSNLNGRAEGSASPNCFAGWRANT